jgi:hypothetical protein
VGAVAGTNLGIIVFAIWQERPARAPLVTAAPPPAFPSKAD